jgi:RNase P/RNase MRP subunit POP5
MSKRYFMVRVLFDKQLTEQHLIEAMAASITKLFGEVGMASINLRLVRYDSERSEAVVVCEKATTNQLLTALTFVREIEGAPISILVVRISGTIKGLLKPKK